MLRLPLTSIAISKADLEQLLHDIDKYQCLIQQGFPRKDVLEYFGLQQDTDIGENASNSGLELPTKGAALTMESLPQEVALERSVNKQSVGQVSDSSRRRRTSGYGEAPYHQLRNRYLTPTKEVDGRVTSVEKSRHATHLYAPRHSSLLKFTDLARSDRISSPEQQTSSHSVHLPNTKPWLCDLLSQESDRHLDVDDVEGTTERLRDLLLEDNVEELQHGGSIRDTVQYTSHNIIHQDDLNDMPTSTPITSQHHVATYTSASARQTSLITLTDSLPSSPPIPTTSDKSIRIREIVGENSPEEEHCPSAVSWRSSSETVPQHFRSNNDNTPSPTVVKSTERDARSFVVYNDMHPPATQPRAPADLQRIAINEYNASYTAPPGMISNRSQTYGFEEGDMSPTIRAIDLRNRRNQEFRRSATVESLRLNRTRRRLRHDALIDSQFNHFDVWRDDLDADRVGEENFDIDPNIFRPLGLDGMRRPSDNRNN